MVYSERLLAKHMTQQPQPAVLTASCPRFDRALLSIAPMVSRGMIEARSGMMVKMFGAGVNNSKQKVLRPYRWPAEI